MNFIGNQQATHYFNTIIDRIIANKDIDHGFLLLCGPQYIGKTTLIQSRKDELVSTYQQSDYLFMRDLSDQRLELKDINDKLTGTDHSIKIQMDTNKADIKLPDWSYYKDYWIRELIERLGKSPTGQRKVVVIENIERMGIGASNALLKTLEEPLENRLIICTCSHPSQLLPTIISRALLINFYPVPEHEIKEWLRKIHWEWSIEHWELFMGRPGLAIRLLQEPKYQELLSTISTITPERLENELIANKLAVLNKLHEQGMLYLALDMLQVRYAQNNTRSTKFLQTKTYLESNVAVTSILMQMFL